MARPILTISSRRWRSLTLAALVSILMVAGLTAHTLSLRNTAHLTGWMLLVIVLFLASYNMRKKVTYPPVVASSTWLQIHLYVGLLSIVLYLFHTGARVPNGVLEGTLAALFIGVAVSGIVGLILSRALPPRLAVRGQEVLFERIPIFRRELRERAERLVLECAEETHLTTLADFYTRRLSDFLTGPRYFWGHLWQSARPLHRCLGELRSLERYLNAEERRIASELSEIIEAKDALDYHHALQSILKGWLFLHIPLTYALILFGLVHAVLAHAFAAGIL